MMLGTIYSAGGASVSGSAVQGVMASESAAAYVKGAKLPAIPEGELARLRAVTFAPSILKKGYAPEWVTQVLQRIMLPSHVLYIKSEARLKAALANIEFIRDHFVPKLMAEDTHALRLAHETKNMVLNAEMKLRTSLLRTESRGNHYREDYPARDDKNWLAWIKIKDEGGNMTLTKVPIPDEWRPDPQQTYEQRYPFRYPGELEYLNKNG
jgi:succinate dehydrogenase/fumarate reductase flavoprotein subunit